MATMHKSPDPKYVSLLIEAGFQLVPLRQWNAIGPRGRKVGKAPVSLNKCSRPSMDIEQAAAHMAEGGNIGIPLGKPLGDKYLCADTIV